MNPWINETGIDYEKHINDLLGFIYEINLKDGRFYVGRKQFWNKRGKSWAESDWRKYYSSSSTIRADPEEIKDRKIVAVFSSKSAIRFAEAVAIIISGAYYPKESGINWSFEGCKGTLRLDERDKEQLARLWERYTGLSLDSLR